MIKYFFVAYLMYGCFQPSNALQKFCEERATGGYSRYEEFHEEYISANGFEQWKKDGKYLMSDEFIREFLVEGDNPESKSAVLLSYWVGEGIITSGFDAEYECDWLEEDRTAAILLMEEMIEIYSPCIKNHPKKKLHHFLDSLLSIKKYFSRIIVDLSDSEQDIYKNEQ